MSIVHAFKDSVLFEPPTILRFHTVCVDPCFQATAKEDEHASRVLSKKWQKESLVERNELMVSPGFSPWTSSAQFRGLGVTMNPRVKDLLDIFIIRKMKEIQLPLDKLEPHLKDCFVDVSQSHQRHTATRQGVNKCLTTSSLMYSYGQDRLLMPIEHIYLQGYPRSFKVPHHASATDLRDFAGEAMCLPCLATVMWSLMYNVRLTSTEADK